MLKEIKGLHHVTSMASNANENNHYFTNLLGLRRIKKTVNFDAPDVYHLYYGDEKGTPGSVMTYFPFPNMQQGRQGTGEVGTTAFAIPQGALSFWKNRLEASDFKLMSEQELFGEKRIEFLGPDSEQFAIVESNDERTPWVTKNVSHNVAIRGFHSASMCLRDESSMLELLKFMNYEIIDQKDNVTRLCTSGGSYANIIDLEVHTSASPSQQGAGSVHHIAFAVENREAQLSVRQALLDTGYQVTPVIDRDYF